MYYILLDQIIGTSLDKKLSFGLKVESDKLPVFVGCSIRSLFGRVIDFPIRQLKANGNCIWVVNKPVGEDFLLRQNVYAGFVRFSLWNDEGFSNRLSDTEWQFWQMILPHKIIPNKHIFNDYPDVNQNWSEGYNDLYSI